MFRIAKGIGGAWHLQSWLELKLRGDLANPRIGCAQDTPKDASLMFPSG
jgi:hypothetical protein